MSEMKEKYFAYNVSTDEIDCASTDMDGIIAFFREEALDGRANISGFKVLTATHYPEVQSIDVRIVKEK